MTLDHHSFVRSLIAPHFAAAFPEWKRGLDCTADGSQDLWIVFEAFANAALALSEDYADIYDAIPAEDKHLFRGYR